jgi:hypothetical protein
MEGIKCGPRTFGPLERQPSKLVTICIVPLDYQRFFSENPDYLRHISAKTTDSGTEEEFKGELPYQIQVLMRENLANADLDSRILQENRYKPLI